MPKRVYNHLKNRLDRRRGKSAAAGQDYTGSPHRTGNPHRSDAPGYDDAFSDEMHFTAGGTPRNGNVPDADVKEMGYKQEPEKVLTLANLRVGLINVAVTSVVAVAFAYGSYAVQQNVLANRIDVLENRFNTVKADRDKEIGEIKSDLKTDVVTKEVLELNLRPIKDQQIELLKIVNEIRAIQIREAGAR